MKWNIVMALYKLCSKYMANISIQKQIYYSKKHVVMNFFQNREINMRIEKIEVSPQKCVQFLIFKKSTVVQS